MQRKRLLVFRSQKKRLREEKGDKERAVGGLRPAKDALPPSTTLNVCVSVCVCVRGPGTNGMDERHETSETTANPHFFL